MAKSEPPDGPRGELGMDQRVAEREPSLARLSSSQPGVNPLPVSPAKYAGQFKPCPLIFSISCAWDLYLSSEKERGPWPAAQHVPGIQLVTFQLLFLI